MENLPTQNQTLTASPGSSKGLKFSKIILILLGLVILVLVGEGIYWLKLNKEKKSLEITTLSKPSITEQPVVAVEPDMVELPTELSLASPAKKEYLETALLDKTYSQVLSFFLPAQESIKAVFGGRVVKVSHDKRPFPNDSVFEEVRLERNDKEFWVSYVIVGKVLVQEGQEIAEGEVLAEAEEGGLKFRSGTNLSFWLHNKDDQMVKLSKEMFK